MVVDDWLTMRDEAQAKLGRLINIDTVPPRDMTATLPIASGGEAAQQRDFGSTSATARLGG
jgi:hypothetical protein